MKIKLCGFREKKSLKVAIEQKCDFIGFIFYEKSPRFITPENAAILAKIIPSNLPKVAVVVDANLNLLEEITQKFAPQYFQFHGAESPEFLLKVRTKFPKIKIIKAFRISDKSDLEKVKNFNDVADLFLFDGKNAGSGKKFDWNILKGFSFAKDWMLSGGLNLDNIEEALEFTGTKMVDVSSGIEHIRGEKSSKLITEFLQKIRNSQ